MAPAHGVKGVLITCTAHQAQHRRQQTAGVRTNEARRVEIAYKKCGERRAIRFITPLT